MKKILSLIGCAMLVFSASAQIPTYASKSASGSTAAAVIFPQLPTAQARVVTAIAQSDLATAALNFYSGTTARYVTATNLTTSNTILVIDSTNGLSPSCLLYVQGATSNVVATLSSWTQTNIWSGTGTVTNTYGYVVATAALGIPLLLNAEVEVLGSATTFFLGSGTNKTFASDALFVGNYGRCVYVTANGTANCGLQSVAVHYDSSSY